MAIRFARRCGLWLCLMAAQVAVAQNVTPPEAEYPYRRDIEKGKYDKAAEKILRHLVRDNESMECHYAAYQLFSHSGFANRNLDSAYLHLVRVNTIFQKADPKFIDRWARDSYSPALIAYGMQRVCRLALREADSIHTPDAYQHFLSVYYLAPDEMRDSATACRDTLEYINAKKAGTIEMLQDFIVRRPSSLLVSDAMHLRDSMSFAEADRQHTASAYDVFRVAYPNSHLYSRATDSVYTLDYRDVRLHDSEQYYRSYATRHPQSPYASMAVWYADSIEYHRDVDMGNWRSFVNYLDMRNSAAWRDTALHHLTHFALHNQHIEAAELAAQHLMPGSVDQQRIGHFLHQAYVGTSVKNVRSFYDKFPELMSLDQQAHDTAAEITNENYHYHNSDSCIRAIAPYHEAYVMLQRLLFDDIKNKRIDQALAKAQTYATAFGDSYEYRQLIGTLEAATSSTGEATALPASINGAKSHEQAPVISADGKTLYFNAQKRKDNIGKEDVFVAHLTAKGWSNATIEMDLSHTYGNEQVTSASPDGNTLVVFQNGKHVIAQRTDNGWQTTPLPDTMKMAQLAPNGRAIIFTAMTKTYHEVSESENIYVSLMDDEGRWGEPIELGPDINTPYFESNAMLHPDMRTLYFASEGHGALGLSDLYMSVRLDDTWTHWSTPVNLGIPFNDGDENLSLQVTTDGTLGYFASRKSTDYDIFTAPIPEAARPQAVCLVSGTVKNHDGHFLGSTVFCEDASTGLIVGQCTPTQGNYCLALPTGRNYNIYVHDGSHFPASYNVNLSQPQDNENITANLQLTSLEHMIDNGLAQVLNNVQFEVANPNFTEESKAELKRLAQIIRQGNYSVEVACHLDGNPGDQENIALTQLRANNIRDYLIELGCRPANISARGYGSDRPLIVSNKTSSKTARPQSRRVEVTLSY